MLAEWRDFPEPWHRPPFDRIGEIDRLVTALHHLAHLSATASSERDNLYLDTDAVRRLKAGAGRDISVGGPDLAAQAIRAGLVDDYHLFVTPVVVGGGKQSLPEGVRLTLELVDERRFGNGVVHLHYRVTR